MKPIIEDEIIKIIGKFDKNKSAGHDGIGNLIVKRVANEIARPLSANFNLSLITGIFPDQLKIAKVIPICKKDDNEIIFSNYRYQSCLVSLKYLKDWYSTDVLNLLIITKF